MQRMVRRYDLAKMVVPPVLWIISLWVPLQGAIPLAETLSGQETKLAVSVSISFAVSIAASGAMIAMFYKYRGQRDELIRLRQRCQELERATDPEKG